MQPILLLHGALGASTSLIPLSKELTGANEVHLIDFSGHGNEPLPANFSMPTFEADILRFMDAHSIHSAHIFGYSMGGFVGLRLAAKEPERILSVSTLATKMDWSEETCKREAAMLDADVLEAKVPKFTAALAATHPRNGWRVLVINTQQMIKDMSRYQLSKEALAEIKQPVRLMVGDRDKMVSIDETVATYRALPNGSLCVLPNTPHPLEQADVHVVGSMIIGTLLNFS